MLAFEFARELADAVNARYDSWVNVGLGLLTMAKTKNRIESLSILLAKEGLNRPEQTIKSLANLRCFAVKDNGGPLGTLYVERRTATIPRWAHFFSPQIDLSELGLVSSSSAVLHVLVDDRVFLLTFGQGRHLLCPESWEEKFGLRTALNSIGVESLRSINKQTLDTYGRHSRVQLSREATPSEFGIDFERDLVREITGKPIDHNIAQRVSGFDALRMSKRTNLNTLRSDLSRLLLQFGQDTYKEKFPWIDYVTEVRDSLLNDRLDLLLINAIKTERVDICWLSIPETIDWADISGFCFRGRGTRPERQDILLSDFFVDNRICVEQLNIEQLKKHSVSAVTDDGIFRHTWSIYQCLYCEIEEAGATYLLTSGRWYKVAGHFVQEVNEFFNKIERIDLKFPEYDDNTEQDYNRRVVSSNRRLFLMDGTVIPFGGGASKVEFCDVISFDRDIIHVKRYSGSSVLSHLFSQGSVSAELYASDTLFRRLINDLLPKELKSGDVLERPDTSTYRIVYAIIVTRRASPITIPFFSRLSLRQAVRTLQGYGYRVGIAKIDVAASRVTLKRYGGKRSPRGHNNR